MGRIFRIFMRIFMPGCLCVFLIFPAQANAASPGRCDETAHICMIAQNDISRNGLRQEESPQSGAAANTQDLSEEGEAEYVARMKNWLDSLPAAKQAIATNILTDSHEEMHKLRKAIYSKKLELAGVRFDNQESLATLPKLGMDLQKLRATLRAKLENINARLMREAGIKMDELAGEGIWLQPLAKTPPRQRQVKPLDDYGVPVSMDTDCYLPVNS